MSLPGAKCLYHREIERGRRVTTRKERPITEKHMNILNRNIS